MLTFMTATLSLSSLRTCGDFTGITATYLPPRARENHEESEEGKRAPSVSPTNHNSWL